MSLRAQSMIEREVEKHIAEMCYVLEMSPTLLDPMRQHLMEREKREGEALEFASDTLVYNELMQKSRDAFYLSLAQTTSIVSAKRWALYIKYRNKYFMKSYILANEMRVAVGLNTSQMHQLFAVVVTKQGDLYAANHRYKWGTPENVQARIDAQVRYISGIDYVMDDEQRVQWSRYVKAEPGYLDVVTRRMDEMDQVVAFTEDQREFLRPIFVVQMMDLDVAKQLPADSVEYKEAMKACFERFYRELYRVLTSAQRAKYQNIR